MPVHQVTRDLAYHLAPTFQHDTGPWNSRPVNANGQPLDFSTNATTFIDLITHLTQAGVDRAYARWASRWRRALRWLLGAPPTPPDFHFQIQHQPIRGTPGPVYICTLRPTQRATDHGLEPYIQIQTHKQVAQAPCPDTEMLAEPAGHELLLQHIAAQLPALLRDSQPLASAARIPPHQDPTDNAGVALASDTQISQPAHNPTPESAPTPPTPEPSTAPKPEPVRDKKPIPKKSRHQKWQEDCLIVINVPRPKRPNLIDSADVQKVSKSKPYSIRIEHENGEIEDHQRAVHNKSFPEILLIAAAEALETIPPTKQVEIHTHSAYLDTAMGTFHHWCRNGWIKQDGEPVKFLASIERLHKATKRHMDIDYVDISPEDVKAKRLADNPPPTGIDRMPPVRPDWHEDVMGVRP